MPRRSIASTSALLAREFGGQVAISIAASAVAAAFLAAPELFQSGEAAKAKTVMQQEEPGGWVSPVAPDGKIGIRHRDAASNVDVRMASVLLTPASLAMPMSTGWPQVVFEEPVSARARSTETHPVVALAAPQRKPIAPLERSKTAESAPMPIRPARLMAPDGQVATVSQASAPASPSGDATPSTLARVGSVMSSAVGTVGAAGIWTLSQASGLLPRL
ncbi:hypothetical protein [Bosea sp. PAMC 26642]|uniref:hypothetical protein n=1 Tax=Bosea sp. (strain PAMC 26642) TaxID=1792307 RepID=UPI0007703EAD|nr:hypothetical protein [Bosea sp. PAMC 26642]AMJ59892.1 hypothetical protein AXW83_05910 [Bosea sp. PAMC 26642]